MKRLLVISMTILTLMVAPAPSAKAEILTFPCGDGATYSVYMPGGVAGEGTNCKGSLILDASVKTIDTRAFYKAEITSVTFPKSLQSIGEGAFLGTKIESVILPDSLTEIAGSAFESVPLNSISFSKSLSVIGVDAFSQTDLLVVKLPNSLKIVGSGAFAYTQITNVTFPNSIVNIGVNAFANTPITSVSIPVSVSIIGDNAFAKTPMTQIEYCGNLSGFLIPPTCTSRRMLFDKASSDKNALDKVTTLVATEIADAYGTLNNLKSSQDALHSEIATTLTELHAIIADMQATKIKMSKAIEYCDNISWTQGDSAYAACIASPDYILNEHEFKSAQLTFDSKYTETNDRLTSQNNEGIRVANQIMGIHATIAILESTPIPTLFVLPSPIPSTSPTSILSSASNNTTLASSSTNAKKTTITCIKGKLTKTVTAVKPACPAGYKKK